MHVPRSLNLADSQKTQYTSVGAQAKSGLTALAENQQNPQHEKNPFCLNKEMQWYLDYLGKCLYFR